MARFPHVCRDCKPPKRNPGCHAARKEYLDAKANHAELSNRERQAKKADMDAEQMTFRLRRG